MTRLTQERAVEIIEYNRQVLYHIPRKYKAIRHYLGASLVRKTLLQIYSFLKRLYTNPDEGNHIVIEGHRYEFFLHTTKLAYGVRQSGSRNTANRHINFLCALGIFQKIPQFKGDRLRVNDNFKAKEEKRKEINVFAFRQLTEKELQRIEERAGRLHQAGITAGNISCNQLALAYYDLEDIADEVYPYNHRSAQNRKIVEFEQLQNCMELLIDTYGYATRGQIKDNLRLSDPEITKLFQIFKLPLSTHYNYHRPKKAEVQQYQLDNQQFIYTRKG